MTSRDPRFPDRGQGPEPLVAAVLLALGVVLTIAYLLTHPSREDPMDHVRAFQEYADSATWLVSHLIQFAGLVCIFGAVVLLSTTLAVRRRVSGALAAIATVLAVSSLAVSAVLQGVDGIALKALVDTWANAGAAEKDVAFANALSLRWVEIGINSFFRLLQGATFMVFGAALALDGRYPAWFGWIGSVAGLGIVIRGLAVAVTGFSLANPLYLWSEVFRVLLYVWLLLLAAGVWRHTWREKRRRAAARLQTAGDSAEPLQHASKR